LVEALIGVLLAFAVGAVLLLERRCLGQIAFVQPLVLCLIAGHLTDNEPLGIWLGVTLQLCAAGQGPQADWSLAGVVAALGMLVGPRFEVAPSPGEPASVALFGSAMLIALGARQLEHRRARLDGAALRARSPWDRPDPTTAFNGLIRHRLARGLSTGGLQTVVGGGAAVLVMVAAARLQVADGALLIAALAVPTLGVAVLLGSLPSLRYLAFAGAGAAASLGWVALA
jgi:mannose/fructose/N-acetylgalactosamine-specific phosphotransferase system component IIC